RQIRHARPWHRRASAIRRHGSRIFPRRGAPAAPAQRRSKRAAFAAPILTTSSPSASEQSHSCPSVNDAAARFRLPFLTFAREFAMKKPVTITITGAAGSIGYAPAVRAASGQMLGPNKPVNLNLLDIRAHSAAVKSVVMELHGCAFARSNKVTATP